MVDNIECDTNVLYQVFVPCTGYGDTYEYDNSNKNDSCEEITIPQSYHCAPTNAGQCQDINKSSLTGDDLINQCNAIDQCNWETVVPIEPLSIVTDCETLSDETSCSQYYLNEQAETHKGKQYPNNFYPVCSWVDDNKNTGCVRGDNYSN